MEALKDIQKKFAEELKAMRRRMESLKGKNDKEEKVKELENVLKGELDGVKKEVDKLKKILTRQRNKLQKINWNGRRSGKKNCRRMR